MRVESLFEFMRERHNIYLKKQAGEPKPWTDYPILSKYRFCNVYRELDTVTQWIVKNWCKPNKDDPHLWFAMVVARFINWPDTLAEIEYPHIGVFEGWAQLRFSKSVQYREVNGLKVYGGAYTISTNGRAMVKWKYLLEHVFKPLWDAREEIEQTLRQPRQTLAEVHAVLTQFQGLGSFMAAQVIADLKTFQLKKAPDYWTWAASGPGSRRGLNRVCNRPKDERWTEDEWKETLDILYERIAQMCAAEGMPRLDAQNLQNSLCEFDKYERVRLGEGRPRSLYPGAA
jgi:hypothetical protein